VNAADGGQVDTGPVLILRKRPSCTAPHHGSYRTPQFEGLDVGRGAQWDPTGPHGRLE